jgi:hypothetical protein
VDLQPREIESRSVFADYIARVFVLAERNEPGMAKMVVLGPFRELELADQLRLRPAAS